MAIGVVDDKDFETEVKKSEITSITGQVINQTPRGRGIGNNEVPDALRKVIGETGAIDGRQEALALGSMFGISPSAASAYANSSNSTASYSKPNEGIKAVINKRKERISRRATNVLSKTLNTLGEKGKLDDVKPVELSTIARNMASIIKEMEPEVPKTNEPGSGGGPTFVLYAPTFINEDRLDTIHLNE